MVSRNGRRDCCKLTTVCYSSQAFSCLLCISQCEYVLVCASLVFHTSICLLAWFIWWNGWTDGQWHCVITSCFLLCRRMLVNRVRYAAGWNEFKKLFERFREDMQSMPANVTNIRKSRFVYIAAWRSISNGYYSNSLLQNLSLHTLKCVGREDFNIDGNKRRSGLKWRELSTIIARCGCLDNGKRLFFWRI